MKFTKFKKLIEGAVSTTISAEIKKAGLSSISQQNVAMPHGENSEKKDPYKIYTYDGRMCDTARG